MSGETTPAANAGNSNIVDLLSTLNPTAVATMAAAANSTTTLTPASATPRNEEMNADSSDFVPANRLLLQRQATHASKQGNIHLIIYVEFRCINIILYYLFQSMLYVSSNNNYKIWKWMTNKLSKCHLLSIGKRIR